MATQQPPYNVSNSELKKIEKVGVSNLAEKNIYYQETSRQSTIQTEGREHH